MKWVNSVDLKEWSNKLDSQRILPELVRKLIRASVENIKNIKFPSGENILLDGWDGILETPIQTEYLPQGISLWEFGTSINIKKKADDDYYKRTHNSLGYERSSCSYIFVTSRIWKNSKDWVESKTQENVWRDVRVIDAEILEEWLEITPSVAAWLATECLGKYPPDGVQSTDFFWEKWATGVNLKLTPELLLGGRSAQVQSLISLTENPNVVAVKVASREEALAFVIASFKQSVSHAEDFLSRSLIVETANAFRQILVLKKRLLLIPMFEDDGSFNLAMSKGHTIIVPLGADSSDNWHNRILLPQIERQSFIKSLVKIGITEEKAENHSKESSRNITILRRQLGFIRNLPVWAKQENVRNIIPALIVGRWDESYDADREILETISGKSYNDYAAELNKLLNISDSPLIRIGTSWRLASPLDAWSNTSKNVTDNDLQNLAKSFKLIMGEIHPKIQSDEENGFSAWSDKRPQYSNWIKEGVTQSLILVSIFGHELYLNTVIKSDLWVDRLVHDLLDNDNPLLWKSFESKLPLLAEASPKEFLNVLEKKIPIDDSPVLGLFKEYNDSFHSGNFHTGLLWALEALAWMPDYFSRSALALAKLASIEPGGTIRNRPINSLIEIFKTWHYQTLATFEDRVNVLKLIVNKEKSIAWVLLNSMLPTFHGIANPTAKMRWRMPNLKEQLEYTYEEIFKTHSVVVDLLLGLCDLSEDKISSLLKSSVDLSEKDRLKILSFIDKNLSVIPNSNFLWNDLRSILSKNRSHPTTNWALSEKALLPYQNLYDKLIPQNEIQKNIFLFNELWPEFIEGFISSSKSHNEQREYIDQKRITVLKSIYQKNGIKRIIKLSNEVKESRVLGDTLARFLKNKNDIIRICELLNDVNPNSYFINSFLLRITLVKSIHWVIDLYTDVLANKFATDQIKAKFFLPLSQDKVLWDFIESTDESIKSYYWENVEPFFWGLPVEQKLTGIHYLIDYKRYLKAIYECSQSIEEISSELLVEVLEKAIQNGNKEDNFFSQSYEIERIFEALHERGDIAKELMLKLEWLYLPLLISTYSDNRNLKALYNELAENPAFFIKFLELVYRPTEEIDTEAKPLTEIEQNRIYHGYQLLHSWKQIPGLDDSGNLNAEYLNNWIDKVRELASNSGRLSVADMTIGQVLAQYPEKDKNWPPEPICRIIERINTDSLKSNFSAATYNKRGSSSRSATEGGTRERMLASYFRGLATPLYNKFPNVAAILERLAKGYDQEAIEEDNMAEIRRLEY